MLGEPRIRTLTYANRSAIEWLGSRIQGAAGKMNPKAHYLQRGRLGDLKF